MKKEDLRTALTKRLLKEGLLRCMKSKRISKISISELCREAGVNRTTFYHHYESPHQVLVDIGWDHAETIREILLGCDSSNAEQTERQLVACFSYVYEHREEVKLLFSEQADQHIADMMQDIFLSVWRGNTQVQRYYHFDDDEYKLAINAFGWSVYYIVRQWIMEDIPKTPTEIVSLLLKLPHRDIFTVL